MIAFVVIAAVMVAAALAWILVPLLRGAAGTGVAREASNVAILRDQLLELEADLGTGVVQREQYEQARRELESRVLEESKAQAGSSASVPSSASAWTAAIVAGSLPLAALLIYVALGNFTAFAPLSARNAESVAEGGASHDVSPAQIEKMIEEVKARLAKDPGQSEGWVILARTYYSLNRYPEAANAFERAAALLPADAGLLADYADALAAAQGGTLQGKPLELVARALAVDPTQWKALALAGTAAFDRKDYAQAVKYWERMKATVPTASPLAQSIDSSIAEARELGGLKAAPAVTPPAVAKAPAVVAPATPSTAAAGRTVAGTVTLAPSLVAKASPDDVVFVFARAAQGPKMPLAILKKQVRDLPITFTLDDSMAMAPNMSLANFPDVVVGARISKSGQAVPQSGDFEGLSAPVKVGTTGIAIVIEKPIP